MALSNPVIFVPGITGTYLSDDYPLPPEAVWSERFFLGVVVGQRNDFERVSLHPDNPRYEAREPARVTSGQLYHTAYEEIIEELRYNLADRKDLPVPVYPFSYDWRLPLEQIEAQFADFVEEIIDRTRLMGRRYRRYAECRTANLVGHSMGGLIIAGYLANCASGRKESKIGKVVTLATPFQGSYEAVVKVATGTGDLGTSVPSPRERRAARLTPSLYHLIPSFENALDVQGDEETDSPATSWFDPEIWQLSIIESLADYIRTHAVAPGNRAARLNKARGLLGGFLRTAQSHRSKVSLLKLKDVGLGANDWLCVVGVNARTRVALPIIKKGGEHEFILRGSDRKDRWTKGSTPEERRLTGDETVPFEGAIPQFLDYENLVCVTPDDFGSWELGNKLKSGLVGFHGILPNMNLLHRLIVRHFTGLRDRHGNTWAWPPPGVEYKDWKPPMRWLRKK